MPLFFYMIGQSSMRRVSGDRWAWSRSYYDRAGSTCAGRYELSV